MTGPAQDQPADRAIELSVEVPGTVEEVWDTIATGPGITSWFVPFTVEPRRGGRVTMDFGSFGVAEAVVSEWEPPHRLVIRDGEGGQGMAYEWLVEGSDGGTCVVRLVNSGFGHGDDWDGQYDGMTEGWTIFLQNLRLQLTHQRGRRGQAFNPTASLPGPGRAAWGALCGALGIPGDLTAGQKLSTSGEAPALTARVESVHSTSRTTAYLLLLEQPSPGTGFVSVEGNGEEVAASVYLYLYGDDVSSGEEWTSWLTDRFPAKTEPFSADSTPNSG